MSASKLKKKREKLRVKIFVKETFTPKDHQKFLDIILHLYKRKLKKTAKKIKKQIP